MNTDYKSAFEDDFIQYIIERYTREAGVRELERHIAALCRFIAIESKSDVMLKLKKEVIERVLGVIILFLMNSLLFL